MVDAHVSGACVERHAGSSPVLGTTHEVFVSGGMAELVDARDLKSRGTLVPCRFEPGFRHQNRCRTRENGFETVVLRFCSLSFLS